MANATITVLEADGSTQTDVIVLDVGRQAAAASKSVTTSTEDKAVLDAIAASLVTIDGRVDGLETLITSTNTKLDTAITSLQIIDDVGRAAEASSLSVAASTEDKAVLDAMAASLSIMDDWDSTNRCAVELPATQLSSILDVTTTVTRPADSSDYASGDAFADSTSAPTTGGFTFTGAAAVSGGGGIITDAVIIASDAKLYEGEVWVFSEAVTAVNDNAAFAVSDANHKFLVGIIPFTLAAKVSTTSVAHVSGINLGYTCTGTANLRFLVRLTAAVTGPGSAAELTVRIKGIRS